MPNMCHSCGLEFEGAAVCPHCGTQQQVPEPGGSAKQPPADDSLEQLRATIEAQSAEIADLSTRLDRLERVSNLRPEPEERERSSWPGRPPPEPTPPLVSDPREMPRRPRPVSRENRPAEPRAREVLPVSRYLERLSEQTAPEAGQPAAPALSRERPAPVLRERPPPREAVGPRWEWLLGGNWLARVGVVALILGVAFFISLAIDRGWLGETERVVLGLLLGAALIGAGERYRTQYGVWAQTVAGGGLAVLYLSIWGGFALYELIGPLLAFGLFILITAAGVMQALRHDSVGLAALAIFGGFATPLLLSDNLPDEPLLIAYVLLLDIDVLALAAYRNWRWFTVMAYVGSLILFGFWIEELDPSLGLAQAGISAIFGVFAGAAVVLHVLRREPAVFIDLLLFSMNGIAYLLISYSLVYDDWREWMGGFTALLALCHAGLIAVCRLRPSVPVDLRTAAAALMVAFAALAVPVQFDGAWVTVAWGIEALALVVLAFALRMPELRWLGYLVFAASSAWLLLVDTPQASAWLLGVATDDLSGDGFTPFINLLMLSYASAIVLPAAAAWLVARRLGELELWERAAVPALAVAAALFAAVAIPVQLDGVWISIGWSIEALALAAISFPLRLPQLRWFGYLVFAAMSIRLLAFDTPDLLGGDFMPFLNLTMLAFGAAMLSAAANAVILLRRRAVLEFEDELAAQVFPVWAALFAVIALPVQVGGVWVAVGWSSEALIVLALAAHFRLDTLRRFGYLVLGAMLVRLAAFDTFDVDLETYWPLINWRFLAFAAGIAALYAAQWIVGRFGGEFDHAWAEEEADWAPRALFGAATLATPWILSAEVFASAESALFDLSSHASENVSILGLTLVWGVYGAGLMLAGVLRRWRWVRVAGLALLIAAVVKLFAYDSRTLEQIYRVIAFIALGAILIAGGLLYQRYRHAVRGFLFAEPD